MYVPASFHVEDRAILESFIDRYAFGQLIGVVDDEPHVTWLPWRLSPSKTELWGHVARANPIARLLSEPQPWLAVFPGPHAYVSPTWYTTQPAVPTWNYLTVQIRGPITLVEQAADIRAILQSLVDRYEQHRPNPWTNNLPPDLEAKHHASIVVFRLQIERIAGKFKLSQNRSRADQISVAEHLTREPGDSPAVAEWMRATGL